MFINDIVIIGSGNVAINIAFALRNIGKNILCIYSRSPEKARHLAGNVSASYTTRLDMLPPEADLYLIAVTDKAIDDVAARLKGVSGIVAHTSGSVSISVFENGIANYGVFYPLMHLSSEKLMDFKNIPLCIEADCKANFSALKELACALSDKVFPVTSAERKILHLAAVFSCNFTNLNYIISEEILKKNGLPFDMLHPIIAETANKIRNSLPSKLQTGPAVREDLEVIGAHHKLLDDFPQYQKIYNLLTEIIIQKKKDNEL